MKRTIWVTQYDQMPWHHDTVKAEIASLDMMPDENPVDFQARGYAHCCDTLGRGYVITKTQNVLDPAVNDWINQRDLQALIDDGMTANVSITKSD